MEGQTEGLNPNEKIPSPPAQLQPNGNVPSIFLAPGNVSQPAADANSSSSNQTTQTAVWNTGGAEMQQRVRSPPSSIISLDSYKVKTCASTQCGSSGYENLASNNGGCQPPQQNRMYPPAAYMQQQQQQHLAIPIRSIHHQHHHHHHHGMPGPCHPHHPQQSNMAVAPHLERMIHGGSSAVAVAAAQQMRSMVMNHYQPNTAGYPHQSSGPGPSASTYYHQTVTTPTGSSPYMEYSHPHNNPHHAHGISAAAAAAVQYAQQQQQHHQRMVGSAATSLSPYRQIPVHHQQKVLSSSQAAAAAYQSAYQQHQYNQYMQQHHGMIASHPHHHQNAPGTTASSVMQQRMLGIPMANIQQQVYLNRTNLPHLHPQQHNHGYSSSCQPALVPNYSGASVQQNQLQHQQQLVNSISSSASSAASNNSSTTTTENVDGNNNSIGIGSNSKLACSSSGVLGTKAMNKKTSSEASIVSRKSPLSSSMKIGSIKLSTTASPDKSVKLKTTRSVTKLRDRQLRLVVGQKKKSVGNISGSSSSCRKLKSLKALAISSTGVTNVDGVTSCNKRLTSYVVEGEGNGDTKRSRKIGKSKTGDVLLTVNPGVASAEENSETNVDENESVEVNRSISDSYFVADQKDEYVPTPEEMRKYLERLNTCNSLNIPLYYAYSVFHGKLSKKDNNRSTVESNGAINSAEGICTERASTTTLFYQPHCNQFEESNFTSYNYWDSSAVSAETEWLNFQNDMAVLEAYFPLLSTMEQSERAEKLDTIYTYEGQIKMMHSSTTSATTCAVGRDQISPPCNCLQDTTSCSCCYNYMTGMIPSSAMASPEECGSMGEQMACRSTNYARESSPQFVMDMGFHAHHRQPHYMSTPLSSRRAYASGTHFYDEDNEHYTKENTNTTRSRAGARKRSSSYPYRKSGRRSSGSRDHLKSETESFLDELISTANDEKFSKKRNNSGEITAPEIQCEVDFPSLESSAAISYNKRRQVKKNKPEENLSARDEYLGSSSAGTEENESNTSACSSSPQSSHNTSSEGDFAVVSDGTLVSSPLLNNRNINPPTNHSVLLSPSCGPFDHDSGACCSRPGHLWDEFRGDEIVPMHSESYIPARVGGASCARMASLNNIITHCTCRRVDSLCPTRPPPGFEHLARPAFPIELYDPSLLGNLIGGQLPREVLSNLDSSSMSRKQFEEMEELLLSLTCCEKHAVDHMLYSRRSSTSLTGEDEPNETSDDDWESLERAIKNVLNEWTEELGFRKRMQDILFSLNLHDLYGGCCKNLMPYEHTEPENIFGSNLSSSKPYATTSTNNEEPVSSFLHGKVKS